MTESSLWRVVLDGDATTTALYEPAEPSAAASASPNPLLVCAHGAGGHMHDKSMDALAQALRTHGIDIVRFNFAYAEAKSRRPDPMPRLEACFEAVVARVREELGARPLFLGGRSMGGRAATMMAARGFECAGLVLFAYPLHPAGQPEKLRDAHLPAIMARVLCFNGTRDALCTPALMNAVIARMPSTFRMHWIEGADHSFHVLKSSGRTDADVLREVAETTRAWVTEPPPEGPELAESPPLSGR